MIKIKQLIYESYISLFQGVEAAEGGLYAACTFCPLTPK